MIVPELLLALLEGDEHMPFSTVWPEGQQIPLMGAALEEQVRQKPVRGLLVAQ